jgi:cytochrome P450
MQSITLDVILRTVFGVSEGPLARLRALIIEMLALAANPLMLVDTFQVRLGPLTNWSRLEVVFGEIDGLLYREIARRRKEGCAGRTDIFSMLVEARYEDGRPMSDVELRDEMMTLLVAGHETTATALAWAIFRVHHTPGVHERLLAELRDVAGRGPIRDVHLPRLEYLDAVVKETLRLNPVIPLVGRRLQEPMTIGGVDLPRGVIAVPCVYLTHRRPDVWPEPERFRPERFLGLKPDPYQFFPFGGGVRRCIGAAFATFEMKIVLCQILSRVSLRAAPGSHVHVTVRAITFSPSGGMPVIADAVAPRLESSRAS